MTVLQEILEWSQTRPSWQRDALRRLVVNGVLSLKDILRLTEICKSAHGLSEPCEAVPLTAEHVPLHLTGGAPVNLTSVFHHRGVNALAEGQTLKFGAHLTAVYGDNGAGKTGYTRILKNACHARGHEQILGNVVSGMAPSVPVVAVKYTVGKESAVREWTGSSKDEFISRVSVFDTQCGSVYLTERTDVAFRPFGLDLFDKLVQACKLVREQIEAELRALTQIDLNPLKQKVAPGTSVAIVLANITSLTKPELIQSLGALSAEENARLAQIEKSLIDLQANDPDKLLKQLTVRLSRAEALSKHLKNVESSLSSENVSKVFDLRLQGRQKSDAAKQLRQSTFTGATSGTGSEIWKELWEAARKFSEKEAYPNQRYPVVDGDATCVLCQQHLSADAIERFRAFEVFVTSQIERELVQMREEFARLRKAFIELETSSEAVEESLKDLRIDDEALAESITAAISTNEERRKAIVLGLSNEKDSSPDFPNVAVVGSEADAWVEQLKARIAALRGKTSTESRKRLTTDADELRARVELGRNVSIVLSEIERKKKSAAFNQCLQDTTTKAITLKSSSVTRVVVSEKLKLSFKEELANLSFHQVEVELMEAGGAEGVLYHKLALTRAPGVELPKVVSEGEQRCLAIAAFFAELSTADDPSGIVFDDPVSSLDYKWRESVARRLVTEARNRQVIVFTHDVVFLLLLKQFAEELSVEQLDQHVHQLAIGAGVCEEKLPWVAMPVKKKIGYLKDQAQEAAKLLNTGDIDKYEKEAKYLYGLLRETWERALEEVLLLGVVERFRPSVQTQQISALADITDADCQALTTAMTKCSRWLPGHDQAAAARAPIPRTEELKADISALDLWVKEIRSRRQK